MVKAVSGDRTYNDVNYVFPRFILSHLPVGLVGLLIAAILAAAMSTISAELASLSTATIIDFYRRWWKAEASDGELLWMSRLATGFWGLFASIVAIYAANLGSLIEVVNRFGSYFYGSLLGVFILALWFPRVNGHGAFVGLFGGMIAVWLVATQTSIEFLWLNIVGAAGRLHRRRRGQRPHRRAARHQPPDGAAVANRPLFIALGVVALVMVLSWALGEFLRQRKTTKRRPKR